MDMEISGKHALVVGASRGLGIPIAKGLAAEGATVLAAARSVGKIEDCSAQMSNVHAVPMVLAKLDAIDGLVGDLLKDGGVGIIVTNGGDLPPGSA